MWSGDSRLTLFLSDGHIGAVPASPKPHSPGLYPMEEEAKRNISV